MTIKELVELLQQAMQNHEFAAKTLEMLGPFMAEHSWGKTSELESLEPGAIYKKGYATACTDLATLIRSAKE